MIGNDIVDRAQARADSNWRRPGYLNKAFTTHEQHLIQSAPDPDRMVWTLWSMKESAYKAAVRTTSHRVFAPRSIVCQLTTVSDTTAEGIAVYGHTYRTQSQITNAYIATVAVSSDAAPPTEQQIIRLPNATYSAQQRVVRETIQQHCALRFGLPPQQITLQKNELGVPVLVLADQVQTAISISHHGYYGAYLIDLACERE